MAKVYGYQGDPSGYFIDTDIDPVDGSIGGVERTEIHAVKYFPRWNRYGFRLTAVPVLNPGPAALPGGQVVQPVVYDDPGDIWNPTGSPLVEVSVPPSVGQYLMGYAEGPEDLRPPAYVFFGVNLSDPLDPLSFPAMDVQVDFLAVGNHDGRETHEEFARRAAENQAASGIPAGTCAYFAMNTAPEGWVPCDGRALSRTGFSRLFDEIGVYHGAGDGSTTFNVPDSRGEFVRGWDSGRGVDSGRAFASFQDHQIEEHAHVSYVVNGSGPFANQISSASSLGGPMGIQNVREVDPSFGNPNVGAETRPRNIALLHCIRY